MRLSMCEFLRATSAAAFALFFSTQVFAANNEAPREPHPLAPLADPDAGSNLAPLASPTGASNDKDLSSKESGQGPIHSSDDLAVADHLRDLIETKLQRYVPQQQDRAGVEAFYRKRDFAPIWIGAGKQLPRAEQAADVLRGVGADGLDPNDYPAPRFAGADPTRL